MNETILTQEEMEICGITTDEALDYYLRLLEY